jgi:hypothetical protein
LEILGSGREGGIVELMVKRKWGASMVVDEIRPLLMEKMNSVGLVHPAWLITP